MATWVDDYRSDLGFRLEPTTTMPTKAIAMQATTPAGVMMPCTSCSYHKLPIHSLNTGWLHNCCLAYLVLYAENTQSMPAGCKQLCQTLQAMQRMLDKLLLAHALCYTVHFLLAHTLRLTFVPVLHMRYKWLHTTTLTECPARQAMHGGSASIPGMSRRIYGQAHGPASSCCPSCPRGPGQTC